MLKNTKLIYFKALLFFLIGIVGLIYCLIINNIFYLFSMLVVTIWAWCRLYYFMFYVITNYIDQEYRFSSIFNFIQYLIKKK